MLKKYKSNKREIETMRMLSYTKCKKTKKRKHHNNNIELYKFTFPVIFSLFFFLMELSDRAIPFGRYQIKLFVLFEMEMIALKKN